MLAHNNYMKRVIAMKCLIIHGSYRKGNTYKVTSIVKSYLLEKEDMEFEELFLYQLDIPFCIGCNQCFVKGEEYCPHSSIIYPIAKKISQSDSIIITAPTYSLQVPGLVKCWIDHMSYHFHRPCFFTKKALVISTTAGAGAKSTTKYIKNVLHYWGVNHVNEIAIRCFAFNYIPDQKGLQKIYQETDKFYAEITSANLHPPSIKRIFLFNLWRSMANSGKINNTKDYQHWYKNQMLEDPFSKEVPLGYLKRVWGHIAYKVAIKILR